MSLIPLTVKQVRGLANLHNGEFRTDGDMVKVKVRTVGNYSFKEKTTDYVSFELSDETGNIICHRNLYGPADTTEMEQLYDGIKVVVHGRLQGNIFQASNVRSVDDRKDLKKIVLDYLRLATDEAGIHRTKIIRDIAKEYRMDVKDISEAIYSLEYDDEIYRTIDEHHLVSTIGS